MLLVPMKGTPGYVHQQSKQTYTPSVPNYKTSQESQRVKTISSLIKIIERNIKIYDIKLIYYENITNKKSNGTQFI